MKKIYDIEHYKKVRREEKEKKTPKKYRSEKEITKIISCHNLLGSLGDKIYF